MFLKPTHLLDKWISINTDKAELIWKLKSFFKAKN